MGVDDKVEICLDCQKWHQVKRSSTLKNTALYAYDEAGREVYGVIQICRRYKSDDVGGIKTRVA